MCVIILSLKLKSEEEKLLIWTPDCISELLGTADCNLSPPSIENRLCWTVCTPTSWMKEAGEGLKGVYVPDCVIR